MASKRNYAGSDGGDSVEPAPKRSKKPNPKTRDHQNAHIDPTWGQKYVFSTSESATTVPVDPDLDFEDDGDAMAYLQSVRCQANGIPHLLVAPKIPIGPQLPKELQSIREDEDDEAEEGEDVEEDRDIYSSGQGDFRGYYHDGAYTARPDNWDDRRENGAHDDGEWGEGEDYEEGDSEAALHGAYFASILSRFHSLRAILHTQPPASVVAALPRTHDHHVGAFGPKSSTFSVWSQRLRSSDPMPAQVASMDKDGVLRVIRVLLGGKFLRRGYELRERTSRWLWALLARLPERGELNHAEIGWVRDLGRRAVLMMQSLADMAALRDALEEEGMDLGVHDAVDESSDDEDVLREMEVEERDGEEGNTPEKADAKQTTENTSEAHASKAQQPVKNQADEDEVDDGEVDDDQKAEPMDVSEDGEVDEGEVSEQHAPAETLEEARARLLARLDTTAAEVPTETAEVDDDEDMSGQLRARMNMRATLNMILTVAGEFYGQRDLLEFRDPFTGMYAQPV
ncbi:snare complex subunit vam7 [Colletotrichum truncatum]|uniref:Snare complex subunit vam7 n=1 Tax=Colletotrichum truncatum TaxID=5467 RepID=A0ACC3YZD7_COLTU|nr:snare complex subunit vam7 [Colletotrichum truncatum]KAF6786229.1 snare complex subunit vam7 [Colletotrichum truncatum]